MDQGIEQNIGVLELDNFSPKSLGLSNYSKLNYCLKNMSTCLIDNLLYYTTTCSQLRLLNNKAVLHLLKLGDFLRSLALHLSLCFLQCLNLPYLLFYQLHLDLMQLLSFFLQLLSCTL